VLQPANLAASEKGSTGRHGVLGGEIRLLAEAAGVPVRRLGAPLAVGVGRGWHRTVPGARPRSVRPVVAACGSELATAGERAEVEAVAHGQSWRRVNPSSPPLASARRWRRRRATGRGEWI
jgi:hypothetical protein